MDLLKFDRRILARNVKKGLITVEERDKYLESLPDLDGEYEIVSIPLYDHEEPEEEEPTGPETGQEAGMHSGENFPPPSVPRVESTPPPLPKVVETAPTPPSTPVTVGIQEVEPTPPPIPVAEPVHSFGDPSGHGTDENPATPPDTTESESTEETVIQSPPNLRPVGGFDDEGNPEEV